MLRDRIELGAQLRLGRMIVSRGMDVVGKGPGLAQNALFYFPLGYDVRGDDHGLRKGSCHWASDHP